VIFSKKKIVMAIHGGRDRDCKRGIVVQRYQLFLEKQSVRDFVKAYQKSLGRDPKVL